MKKNELATIIAFYLSKFDKQAVHNLGFDTDSDAFEFVANKLEIKKNYIKFRRDEFDPIHPWRVGWQRPMAKPIANAIELLQDLSELELREIVLSIIDSNITNESELLESITSLLNENTTSSNKNKFIPRGITGRKAEEYFMDHYEMHSKPFKGNLIDTRDLGVGYDFKIEANDYEIYIEVKGLSSSVGGILISSKEWETAIEKGNQYYLILVSGIKTTPIINFIQNPAEKLSPKRSIIRPIQINWTVSDAEINKLIKK